MSIYDIRETAITVYRVLNEQDAVQGYTLAAPVGGICEVMVRVDPDRDYVDQLQVHVFSTEEAAWAFREGLIFAGEDEVHSLVGTTRLGHAVLRECFYPPDDEDDPTVKVILNRFGATSPHPRVCASAA